MRRRSVSLLSTLCLFIFSQALYAAPDLTAGQRDAVPGATVSIPVNWVNDGSVVAQQFDLVFDASALNISNVSAGAAGAGHTLDWQVVGAGRLRVVLSTPVVITITSGNLVNVDIAVASNAPVGEYPLIIENSLFANDQARPVVPTSVVFGNVNVLDALPPLDPVVPIPGLGWFAMLVLISLLAGLGWLTIHRGLKSTLMSVFLGGLLFSSTLVQAAALPGDANNDGHVTAADIPVIVAQILERQTSPGDPDCNQDGSVDILDTICVANKSVVNSPPVLSTIADRQLKLGATLNLTATASDADLPADTLVWSLDQSPSGMTITASNGAVSWTPDSSQLGTHTTTVRVVDSEGTFDFTSFNVEVISATTNMTPDLIPPGNRVIAVGSNFQTQLFATDPDAGDVLTFSLVTGPAGLVVDAAGSLSWNPAVTDLGANTVTARVSDVDGLTDDETFNIEVVQAPPQVSSNRPPSIVTPANLATLHSKPVNISASASDPDAGDTLSFSLVNAPTGLSLNPTSGAISWTPQQAQVGAHDVALKVEDSHGAAAFGSFTITVSHQNRPPVASDQTYVARIGETLTVNAAGVLENDTDPDGDVLSAALVSGTQNGELNLRADGSFDFTPRLPPPPARDVELELQCENTNAVGHASNTVAVGDTNNDGKVEIVGAGFINGTSVTELWVMNADDCSVKLAGNPAMVDAGGWTDGTQLGLLDIDENGDLEIIGTRWLYPTDEGGQYDGQHLLAVHHDGTLAWGGNGASEDVPALSGSTGQWHHSGPTFADLNGDGKTEIVMAYYTDQGPGVVSGIAVFKSADGTLLWSYDSDQVHAKLEYAPPLVVDLDGDGKMEIIIHSSVIDHEGNLKFLLPSEQTVGSNVVGHLTSAVADFTGDSTPEIISRDNNFHYLFNADGTLVWNKAAPNNSVSPITVADFDGDGLVEFAYVTTAGNSGSETTGFMVVYDTDGTQLWSHQQNSAFTIPAAARERGPGATAFDLNLDGAADLVIHYDFGVDPRSGIYMFSGRDGSQLGFEPIYAGSNAGDYQRFVTIVDVDDDGEGEIISSFNDGASGRTAIWRGTDANPLPSAPSLRNQWQFNQSYVDEFGTPIADPEPAWQRAGRNGFNLVSDPMKVYMQDQCRRTNGPSYYFHNGTMVVGDVDNDGDIEMFGISGSFTYSIVEELWIMNAADCGVQYPPYPKPAGWPLQPVIAAGGLQSDHLPVYWISTATVTWKS